MPNQANDRELGQQLAQTYQQEMGIAPTHETDAIRAYLQSIVDRLTHAFPHPSR